MSANIERGFCVKALKAALMDGKGRYHGNIFIGRLWRLVNYEDVYLKEYTTLKEAKSGLNAYFACYKTTRLYQPLAYQATSQVHFALARGLS